MNPDLLIGDTLKNTGAGNLFMIFGEPDIAITRDTDGKLVVEVKGVDVYDPMTGQIRSSSTDDMACWFIDTDYNGECYFVRHAYFLGADDPYAKLKAPSRRDRRGPVDHPLQHQELRLRASGVGQNRGQGHQSLRGRGAQGLPAPATVTWTPDRSQRMAHDEYTTILREITSELTGDWNRDRVFLNHMTEKYVHHPQGKKILRAIGRLLYTHMPEEFREEVGRIVQNDADYHQTVLAEVRHLIQERRIDEARQLIDEIVPPADLYAEDEVSIYYSFKNPVEFIFFEERFAPEKTIRVPPFPFNEVYELLLYLQVEQMQFADSPGTIAVALKRNPLNTTILFEVAELHKMRKEIEEFLAGTVRLHPFLYRLPGLARYFRNLGYYSLSRENGTRPSFPIV